VCEELSTRPDPTNAKLILIDGNGLAYRSFYAVPPRRTSWGLPSNAILGFGNLLLGLLHSEKPSHVAVAFDKSAPTERLQKYQDYNAQREEMPEDLSAQLPFIEELVAACGIPVYRVRGHEADDCIGTLATRAAEDGFSVLIVSGDLDLLQLVGPQIRVLTTRRGIGDLVVYDEAAVRQRFNLLPRQLADLRALAGDSSQNISGVPGIGEVTARKLLSQYSSLEELLASLAQLPAKWRNPLSENREQAIEFKARATILTRLDIEIDWESCAFKGVHSERLRDVLRRLELDDQTVGLSVYQIPVHKAEPPGGRVSTRVLQGDEVAQELDRLVKERHDLAMHWVLDDTELAGVAFADGPEQALYIPLGPGKAEAGLVWQKLVAPLNDPSRQKYVYNLKQLMRGGRQWLWRASELFDVAVASAVLDPGEQDHRLPSIARRHGLQLPGEAELWGPAGEKGHSLDDLDLQSLADWAGRQAVALAELAPRVARRLEAEGLVDVFRHIEMPLVLSYSLIEDRGLSLDPERLGALRAELEKVLADLRSEIFARAEKTFDLDSDKELGEYLFDTLGLLVPARPKNGGPIGAEVLVQVTEQHPVAAYVRDYRELVELRSLYVDGLRGRNGNGKSRSGSFNPATTCEGRLGWSGAAALPGAVPAFHKLLGALDNLQNVEARWRLRRLLESAVVAREPGHLLVMADFPQLELRVLAHLAGERSLQEALRRDRDVEQELAAEFFGVPAPEVTAEMRRTLVSVLTRGMGCQWLARRLNVTPREAAERQRKILASFYQRFPGVEAFHEAQLEQARRQGWVATLGGRRRMIPELSSRNFEIREAAERLARSAAVEGSVAEILKRGVVELGCRHEAGALRATLVLQVYNQFLLESSREDLSRSVAEIGHVLSALQNLAVPLRVRLHSGPNWSEMEEHDLESAASA
jgi:DNA polymerase-1